MDGEQSALGFGYVCLQIPLERTRTAVLWPKLIETSLFLRKTDVSLCIRSVPRAPNGLPTPVSDAQECTLGSTFCLQSNSILWMGNKMPLESPTLALKSHSNAHALPICGPNPLKPQVFPTENWCIIVHPWSPGRPK